MYNMIEILLVIVVIVCLVLMVMVIILRHSLKDSKARVDYEERAAGVLRTDMSSLREDMDNFKSDTRKRLNENHIRTLSIGDEFTPLGARPIDDSGPLSNTMWTDEFRGSMNVITSIDYDVNKFSTRAIKVDGEITDFNIDFNQVSSFLWTKRVVDKSLEFKFR